MSVASEPVPHNAVHIGELNVSGAIGVNFNEPEHLSQLTQPLDVFRSRTHDGDRFDAVVRHEPMSGREFLGFLNEVAPYKGFAASPEGVIGDWNVVDRMHDPQAVRARELVEMHKALGGPWLEFLKSQPAFLGVMEDARAPRFDRRYSLPSLIKLEHIRSQALSDVTAIGANSVDDMLDILERGVGGIDRELVLDALKAEVNKKRKSPQKPIKKEEVLQRRFKSWSEHRRMSFIRDVLGDLPEEDREAFIESTVDELYDTAVMPDGVTYGYRRAKLPASLDDIYAARTTVVDGAYKGEYIQLPNEKGDLEDVLVPGSVHRFVDGPTIAPLISWSRSRTGERDFIIERRTRADGNFRFNDGVLGVLAIAYFSPDVRAIWKDKLPIRGSVEQIMGAAQVPVLALMRQGQLLKTDFVQAVESAA